MKVPKTLTLTSNWVKAGAIKLLGDNVAAQVADPEDCSSVPTALDPFESSRPAVPPPNQFVAL